MTLSGGEFAWNDECQCAPSAPVAKIAAALDEAEMSLGEGATDEQAIAEGFGLHLMPYECSAVTLRGKDDDSSVTPQVELRFAVADGPCAGQRHDVQARTLKRCIEIARAEIVEAEVEAMRPVVNAFFGGYRKRPARLVHVAYEGGWASHVVSWE